MLNFQECRAHLFSFMVTLLKSPYNLGLALHLVHAYISTTKERLGSIYYSNIVEEIYVVDISGYL